MKAKESRLRFFGVLPPDTLRVQQSGLVVRVVLAEAA
jgi:hypothetical protein